MKEYEKHGLKISLPDWVEIIDDAPLFNAALPSDPTKGIIVKIFSNANIHTWEKSRLVLFKPMKNHPLLDIHVIRQSETVTPFIGVECLQKIYNKKTSKYSIRWEGVMKVKDEVYLSWLIDDHGDYDIMYDLWKNVLKSMKCSNNVETHDLNNGSV